MPMEDAKMPLVKIKKNFQVNIPLDVRKDFPVVEGDYVEMKVKNGKLVLEPVTVQPKKSTTKHAAQ
jgi:AbrB family looped-hinge helix DNA binding protein